VDAAFGGSAGGKLLTQNAGGDAGTFEIHASNPSGATVTFTPEGLARYTLNDNGKLLVTGETGATVSVVFEHGGTLNSTSSDPARAGTFAADNIAADNFTLGAKLQTPALTIGDSGTGAGFVVAKAGLLSGVENIILKNGAKLDLATNSQSLAKISVPDANSRVEIAFDKGNHTVWDPLVVAFNSLELADGALLHFPNWESPLGDGGLGLTRIIADTTSVENNLRQNTLIRGIKLADIASETAIVKRADDTQYILLPFDQDFIWDGSDANTTEWKTGNWAKMGASANWHVNDEQPGLSDNDPSAVTFDTEQKKYILKNAIYEETETPSIADGTEIKITTPEGKSLFVLEFRGASKINYAISGEKINLTTGVAAADTQTDIINTGAANVTIKNNIDTPYDSPAGASKSATVNIGQEGTGNLVFEGEIRGPGVRYIINTTQPAAGETAGYIAFKGNNSFDRGLVLNGGVMLVGSNTAFGNSNGLFIWNDGVVKSIANTSGQNNTAEYHGLDNPYQLNPANTILTLDGDGSLAFKGHGAVMKNTTLDVKKSAATLTLGGYPNTTTNLDAAPEGATLTLTGAGKVAISATTVGEAGKNRTLTGGATNSSVAFDVPQITTGALTLHIQNAETTFASEHVYSQIDIGVNGGVVSKVTGTGPSSGAVVYFTKLITVNRGSNDVSTLTINNTKSMPTMFLQGIVNNGEVNIKTPTTITAPTEGPNQGKTIVETFADTDPNSGKSRVNILNQSVLTLNVPSSKDSTTYKGVITGDSGAFLAKSGAGKQILSGRNTYNGAGSYTNVNEGTLKITGVLGASADNTKADYEGKLAVSSGATLHFYQSENQTYSGTTQSDGIQGEIIISGSGAFTLAGSLSGIIDGNSAPVGDLTVNGGKLILDNTADTANNGIITLGQTTFGGGATLAGNGKITGNVSFAKNVTISPGNLGASDESYFGKIELNSAGTVEYDNIKYNINVAYDANNTPAAVGTLLSHTGTGSVVFSDGNTIDINGDWVKKDAPEYVILTAAGGIGSNGGGTDYKTTTFLEKNAIPDPHHFYSLSIKNDNKALVLTAVDAYYALYWGGEERTTTTNWADKDVPEGATKEFYRANVIAAVSDDTPLPDAPDYYFANGDIVIFADTPGTKIADSIINVHGNGVEPNTLVISGDGTNITFRGGAITIKPYERKGVDSFAEYAGPIPVALKVQGNAVARFENTVRSDENNEHTRGDDTLYINTGAKVYVGANGTVEIRKIDLGTRDDNPASPVLPGTLIFEKTASNQNLAYTGTISGAGHVELRGTDAAPVPFTLTGNQTHTGDTRVSGGTLEIVGGLGAVYDKETNTLTGYNYTGKIELTKSGNGIPGGIAFSGTGNTSAALPQTLSGTISGLPDTDLKIDSGGTFTIASDTDNTPHRHPKEGKTAAEYGHNTFQGNISVSENSELTISGRLNVVIETFDGGAQWGISYQHSQYGGNITVASGSTVNFTYNRDYQLYTGTLSGAGTLNINTGMPFYFNGKAHAWQGKTHIGANSAFHLTVPEDGSFGNGLAGSALTVSNGSALYVGGGGKIYTRDFQMEAGTRFVVNAGGFTIQAPDAGNIKFGAATGDNVTFVFRITGNDAGKETAQLAFATDNATGVELSGGKTLRVDYFGAIPFPSENGEWEGVFTLMSGLDTLGMGFNGVAGDTAREKGETLAAAIFTEKELNIKSERFSLFFTSDGKLMVEIALKTNVPEPWTYSLFSGVFIAGLALLHRRRKKSPGGMEIA
jgi:autotransporter-associated beta strand protein